MRSTTTAPTYRLVRREPEVDAPELDDQQRQVVEHPGGPLLVLAGPGTGKTTTLVEAIAHRIDQRGADPASVLALTFSRKAAEQLRDRVTARLGRTLSTQLCSTFHSFAYALVRRYAPSELYVDPMRLLSAPEQDVVLQELLRDTPESVQWPESLTAARATRGFAREVQSLLARSRERGLGPTELVALGRDEQMPEWEAAGHFLHQYLDVLASLSAIDYPDLIARAVIEAELHRTELRREFQHVFVDEYQDTDPSQVSLLQALAGDGRNLTVVGDPDQSIYAFRGAEVRGILDFPAQFTRPDGTHADVIALRTNRRFGPELLAASRCIASSITTKGSIPRVAYEAFRHPEAADNPFGAGSVSVLTFDSPRAEAEHLADLLRRAHLEEGIGWSDMAVLVRSGRASIPSLRRALASSGVPVEVASDETPLAQEPAVVALLDALAVVVHAGIEDPKHPDYVDVERAMALLTSPLCGLDATDLRSLARALRTLRTLRTPGVLTSSGDLIRRFLLDATGQVPTGSHPAQRAHRLAELVARARQEFTSGASVEQVLWTLWSGCGWGRHLETTTQQGGSAARLAHRDLDAVCALFDLAARAEERQGHTGVREFLETVRAQEIPADTLAERGVRGEAVRLLTAHRAKGLEWRLVVVAHVQDGMWPDLRRRSTLLSADRVGLHGVLPQVPTAELLAEERRLFYVACTRARERLVVTAVNSQNADGESPSRFLAELGCAIEHRKGRLGRPLSLAGLVAALRRTTVDPAQPEALRDAAARRLKRLASVRVDETDEALVPAADPATWWGLRQPTRSDRPIRDPEPPLALSASTLSELADCPVRWFLTREAGGSTPSSARQSFGTIVHALVHRMATGDLQRKSIEEVMELVAEVWGRLSFSLPWASKQESAELEAALARYLRWHEHPDRALAQVVTELRFKEVDVTVGDADEGFHVRLSGSIDRLEHDGEGNVRVIDFKTGSTQPSKTEGQQDIQLALYQYVVDQGHADDAFGRPVTPAGADLVMLRLQYDKTKLPKSVSQSPLGEGGGQVEQQLFEAASLLRGEKFTARPEESVCKFCDFQTSCPAQTPGSVLS